MDDIVTRPAEEMSREELYELVWQTPMSKLGAQLATNGPGLAALCRKRQIPTPPLGYWQKKELCLNLGDAHSQAARFSASSFTSTPSLNLIPSMTFGNWFLPLRRSHFLDAA